MSFWIARDKNKNLCVFVNKPIRGNDLCFPCRWMPSSPAGESLWLGTDHPIGKDLTWEDEPLEVELVEKGAVERAKKRELNLRESASILKRKLEESKCGVTVEEN